MSFSIAPGKILKLPVEQVLLISRVQGSGGQFELIQQATKNLNDISTQNMLLVAIEAIATALGIPAIAGICAKDQISVELCASVDALYNVYDEFWRKHGGEKVKDDLFFLPVPLPHKTISMIKRDHRCRVKYKRQLKKELMEQVCRTFEQKCLKDGARRLSNI